MGWPAVEAQQASVGEATQATGGEAVGGGDGFDGAGGGDAGAVVMETGFGADVDVGRPDVEAQHLRSPTGTGRLGDVFGHEWR